MMGIKDIYRWSILIVFLVGTIGVGHCPVLEKEKENQHITSEQTGSQDNESQQFVQSFDVVAQNVQLQLVSPILPELEVVDNWAPTSTFLVEIIHLTGTNFFKILFRSFISVNAP